MNLEFSSRNFPKILRYQIFRRRPFSGSVVIPCVRADRRRTERRTFTTKLLVTFRNFANAPKNEHTHTHTYIYIYVCVFIYIYIYIYIYALCVPLAAERGISLIILPLMRILQWNLKRTADTFLNISHTTNVLLFKFRCNIFVGVRIIKELPDSVASGTHYF